MYNLYSGELDVRGNSQTAANRSFGNATFSKGCGKSDNNNFNVESYALARSPAYNDYSEFIDWKPNGTSERTVGTESNGTYADLETLFNDYEPRRCYLYI